MPGYSWRTFNRFPVFWGISIHFVKVRPKCIEIPQKRIWEYYSFPRSFVSLSVNFSHEMLVVKNKQHHTIIILACSVQQIGTGWVVYFWQIPVYLWIWIYWWKYISVCLRHFGSYRNTPKIFCSCINKQRVHSQMFHLSCWYLFSTPLTLHLFLILFMILSQTQSEKVLVKSRQSHSFSFIKLVK